MLQYINIFGFKMPTYGMTILIGTLLGIYIAIQLAKKVNIKSDDIIYGACFIGIGAAIGAKLLYVITTLDYLIANFSYLISDFGTFFSYISSGFVFYGGLIGGVCGLFVYCKVYKIDFFDMTDTFIPVLPLIHAFGRIGCFLAGCCYGMPFDPPIGMMFNHSDIAPHGIHLLPVQLFESGANIIIFFILMLYWQKKKIKGNTIFLYGILYGIMRFVLEFFRYDAERGIYLFLSTSQWISIGIVIICVPMYFINIHKNKNTLKQN